MSDALDPAAFTRLAAWSVLDCVAAVRAAFPLTVQDVHAIAPACDMGEVTETPFFMCNPHDPVVMMLAPDTVLPALILPVYQL